MEVRWPEGRWLLTPLAAKFGSSPPDTIGLLHGMVDLFFPAERPKMDTTDSEGDETGEVDKADEIEIGTTDGLTSG